MADSAKKTAAAITDGLASPPPPEPPTTDPSASRPTRIRTPACNAGKTRLATHATTSGGELRHRIPAAQTMSLGSELSFLGTFLLSSRRAATRSGGTSPLMMTCTTNSYSTVVPRSGPMARDRPPRTAAVATAALVVLMGISTVASVEAWPLGPWELFSRTRQPAQTSYIAKAVADGRETTIDFGELPYGYSGAHAILGGFLRLSPERRAAVCEAWAGALDRAGRPPDQIR